MVFLIFAEGVQLVPDGTVFIHIALILLMIWILNRTFFRPVNRVIETRENKKGGRFGEAESIMRQVGDKQAEYNREMLAARSEGYGIIEKERAAAVARREAELSRVKQEVTEKFDREKTEIEKQAVEARSGVAAQAEALADKISSSILKA